MRGVRHSEMFDVRQGSPYVLLVSRYLHLNRNDRVECFLFAYTVLN